MQGGGGGLAWVGLGQGLTQAGIAGLHIRSCAALVPDPGCSVRLSADTRHLPNHLLTFKRKIQNGHPKKT